MSGNRKYRKKLSVYHTLLANQDSECAKNGQSEAILLGGNLGALYLLQDTEYQPKFDEPFIFALEDDDEAGKYTAKEVSTRFE